MPELDAAAIGLIAAELIAAEGEELETAELQPLWWEEASDAAEAGPDTAEIGELIFGEELPSLRWKV